VAQPAAATGARSALEQTLLFGALDGAALDRLAAASIARPYTRGQVVVTEGDPGGDVLVIGQGRLKVFSRSPAGDELIHRVVIAGDTLGEVSMWDNGPRSAAVEALEPSVVVSVPGDAVRIELRAAPDLAEELLRQQAQMIRRTTGIAADLVFLDLPRRLAKFVLDNADGRGRLDLGLSQGQLAAAVGGVRQTVNGALRGFERRGWLQLDGRVVVVTDAAALTMYAKEGGE
jgi:CRP-like cAMP-binding protein